MKTNKALFEKSQWFCILIICWNYGKFGKIVLNCVKNLQGNLSITQSVQRHYNTKNLYPFIILKKEKITRNILFHILWKNINFKPAVFVPQNPNWPMNLESALESLHSLSILPSIDTFVQNYTVQKSTVLKFMADYESCVGVPYDYLM